jgi:hypothetical protein
MTVISTIEYPRIKRARSDMPVRFSRGGQLSSRKTYPTPRTVKSSLEWLSVSNF